MERTGHSQLLILAFHSWRHDPPRGKDQLYQPNSKIQTHPGQQGEQGEQTKGESRPIDEASNEADLSMPDVQPNSVVS